MTPTQRTLKYLRDDGWTAAVVEKWNPHAKIRQDLFGFIDILAVRDAETLAVQATSAAHISTRVKKIADAEHVTAVRDAGWQIWVVGWRKNAKGRWVERVVDVS